MKHKNQELFGSADFPLFFWCLAGVDPGRNAHTAARKKGQREHLARSYTGDLSCPQLSCNLLAPTWLSHL